MKSDIQIRNSADVCYIDIEGTIGVPEQWQFASPDDRVATYEKFRDAVARIAALDAPQVVVNIRSTGGDVNDALLIYDALAALDAEVTTRCYGYVASAATLIAQAASEGRREISAGALYLVHAAACAAEGNAAELEARAKLLEVFTGKTVLLVGQSGMGKSTILNLLVPEANAQTREFSEALDLGKQTTTAAAWHAAPEWQGAVIDTPGFQEFGLAHLSLSDILRAMPDIAEHAVGCRFFNCRHLHEPGCGVKAALEAGLIDPARYAFYEAAAKDADPLPR